MKRERKLLIIDERWVQFVTIPRDGVLKVFWKKRKRESFIMYRIEAEMALWLAG
jgi:hypothetical protein